MVLMKDGADEDGYNTVFHNWCTCILKVLFKSLKSFVLIHSWISSICCYLPAIKPMIMYVEWMNYIKNKDQIK